MMGRLMAHLLVAMLWLLHLLPLPLQAAVGWGFGRLLWWLARGRRRVALTNLALCFPQWSEAERTRVAREHFGWLGRSLLERGMLWFASEARLKRLVQVEGDVAMAERTGCRVLWLLPHFVGLDFVAPALLLNQSRPVVDIYQRQSNAVLDARVKAGRNRFGRTQSHERREGFRPVMRAIKDGAGFVSAPDMDFGTRESAFVPFFGVATSTLVAPARIAHALDMTIQPLVVTMLPRGRGYRVRFMAPPPGMNDADEVAGTAAFNRWLEERILEQPAQYWWVHRRFKTRPPGEASVYARGGAR